MKTLREYIDMVTALEEAADSKFAGFMNKALGAHVDQPKPDAHPDAPEWYKNAPVHDMESVAGGWGKALRWGLSELNKLNPAQKAKLAARGEYGVTDWLTERAIKKGLVMDYENPEHTEMDQDEANARFPFAQEDIDECQGYLEDVFHDPNIDSWLKVLTDAS